MIPTLGRLTTRILSTLHPEGFHGTGESSAFFEGWYVKLVAADRGARFAVIPGVFLAPDGTGEAFVQVLDGATGERVWKRTVGTLNGGDVWTVRQAGDLNQDGYPDLVVSDPYYTSLGGYVSGEAWVIPGGSTRFAGTGDLIASAMATIQGVDPTAIAGADARGIGDFFAGTRDGSVRFSNSYTLSRNRRPSAGRSAAARAR